jgi:cellulose synthase/poly-beta-1,6-N-acetylglucosamine synthase-like glycosyltransferase
MSSPRFRQMVILATIATCLSYLVYRVAFTLNLNSTAGVIISVSLILAEAFGIVSVLLYSLQVWDPREPARQPVLPGRTVDVFVPTYNEDPMILRATLEACMRLDYPGRRVYLCDDGGTEARCNHPENGPKARERQAELKAICDELGVTYLTRPKNEHAKAGNLNHAFTETDGEFIIIFDADHVPEPHFISRLIGYFADERLGYIQTPHAFYNFNSFQARLDHKNRKYWEEGALFYGVIQPGRNRWNCPIFAGSAAMFRRQALEEVGYIALETITEDMHTGMRMNAKGWKSLAISERMVAGQAAPDITTFHVQRLRWGEGNLSIMAYDNPLTMKGLTLSQRLCYLGSMIHWAGGLFKLVIYLTPIVMMLSGVSPVREFTWTLFTITVVYMAASIFGVQYMSNGYGSVVYGELFAMVNFWTQIRGTMRAIFWRKFQQFVVTSKRGRQSKSIWPFIRPHVVLFFLSFLALSWGWGRILYGISDDYFKPIIPSCWIVFHMVLIAMTVRRAMWPEDGRFSFRHAVNVVVRYEAADGTSGVGVTIDLNELGLGMVSFQRIPAGTPLQLKIDGGGEVVECSGRVMWTAPAVKPGEAPGQAYRLGIKFDPLPGPVFDAINRITMHYGVPRLYLEYAEGNRKGTA